MRWERHERPTARFFVPRFAFFALFSVGCNVAHVGSESAKIPKDGADQCAAQCIEMGLRLSAVALMANRIGCVCQPPEAPQAQNAVEAVPAAGMATVLMIEQQQQQEQQQQSYYNRR